MKLIVLMDNNTIIDRYYIGEPGLSFYIEEGDKKILLDTGYSDGFLRNADKMGIDLLDIDYICLSHGHIDHTWGLDGLYRAFTEANNEKRGKKRPLFIAHEGALLSKTYEHEFIGSLLPAAALDQVFDLEMGKEPRWITEKLVFLGQIERTTDFENLKSLGRTISTEDRSEIDDYILDDSALAYKSENGLVILTGCSHSGIGNIVAYAKKICEEDRIADIIGGLHLLDASKELLEKTSSFLGAEGVTQMHPCHCTDLAAKIELSKFFKVSEVGVGTVLEYE